MFVPGKSGGLRWWSQTFHLHVALKNFWMRWNYASLTPNSGKVLGWDGWRMLGWGWQCCNAKSVGFDPHPSAFRLFMPEFVVFFFPESFQRKSWVYISSFFHQDVPGKVGCSCWFSISFNFLIFVFLRIRIFGHLVQNGFAGLQHLWSSCDLQRIRKQNQKNEGYPSSPKWWFSRWKRTRWGPLTTISGFIPSYIVPIYNYA